MPCALALRCDVRQADQDLDQAEAAEYWRAVASAADPAQSIA